MPLNPPNLDDRGFEDLLSDAKSVIQKDLNTNWNDLSPGDPGIVLLEAFAFLTEQMLYRLNRLPDKAYIAFLRLLGVSLQPPTAARVELSISQTQASEEEIFIPKGTPVTLGSGGTESDLPVFMLGSDITFAPISAEALAKPVDQRPEGSTQTVMAYHCERVEEIVGVSNGKPGQVFKVRQPPIIAPLHINWLDLKVLVEVEGSPGQNDVEIDGTFFREWMEVPNFADCDENSRAFVVDYHEGTIQFAPAARMNWPSTVSEAAGINGAESDHGVAPLAAVPAAGCTIRVHYSRGGGEAGNIPAGRLIALQNPDGDIPVDRLAVINMEPARGGFEGETLANALIRGPQEAYSLERVVTSRDYERAVLSEWPSILRAKAFAQTELWQHGTPGMVEVALVPALPASQRQHVQFVDLQDAIARLRQSIEIIETRQVLDQKSALGTFSELTWARYKKVRVNARLRVRFGENEREISERLTARLNRMISPLPSESIDAFEASNGQKTEMDRRLERIYQAGWPFGQKLRVADIYRMILATEQAVTLITSLELQVESAPDRMVRTLVADHFQAHTWFAGSENRLFRSTDDGEGWEQLMNFSSDSRDHVTDSNGRLISLRRAETVKVIRTSPQRSGLVAAATMYSYAEGDNRCPLYISADCGESWFRFLEFDSEIEDMAWMVRGDQHILLIAGDKGLVEVYFDFTLNRKPRLASHPSVIPVIPGQPTHPLYAVAVLRGEGGKTRVAVAAKSRAGVYMSRSSELTALPANPLENELVSIDELSEEELNAAANATNFDPIRLQDQTLPYLAADIRHLNVQWFKNHLSLWAGTMAVADSGYGCYRWEFDEELLATGQEGWVDPQGWNEKKAGSCFQIAFQGSRALAVTARGGIFSVDIDQTQNAIRWQPFVDEEGILPHHRRRIDESSTELEILNPIYAIATNEYSENPEPGVIMIGNDAGVFRSLDGGQMYEKISRTIFRQINDAVTIPQNWLLVSWEHSIEVNVDDETGRAAGAQ